MNRILISFGFGLLLALFANAENAPIYTCNANNGKNPFTNVGGNYYIFVEEKLRWIKAAHYCRKKGAHLASLENVAEQRALSDFIASNKPEEIYWLSGNDIEQEGTFSWLGTGNDFTDTTKFDWGDYGGPSNGNKNEHCLSLSPEKGRFILNDDTCEKSYYFICEASFMSFFTS